MDGLKASNLIHITILLIFNITYEIYSTCNITKWRGLKIVQY